MATKANQTNMGNITNETTRDKCASRARYPLINPQGKHTANIDISKLTIAQLRSIYASGYCILTTKLNNTVNATAQPRSKFESVLN